MGGVAAATLQHQGRHDKRAGAQGGIEAAGEAEADERLRVARHQSFGRGLGTLGHAAADFDHPVAPREARFGFQPDDETDRRDQNPQATRRSLLRWRLRKRAIASSGKNSL